MIIPQISYFDLVNLYHEAKYYKTEHPMYGYEIEKGKFVKITDTKFERMKSGEIKIIPFIDAYQRSMIMQARILISSLAVYKLQILYLSTI